MTLGDPTVAQTLEPSRGDDVAALQLIAAPGLSNGRYTAGIDIRMAPGSHTYWKQPGEAGVPPVFAFTGSQNVAKAELVYPAPVRISEAGIEAYGYKDAVVFPVAVTPIDRAKPVLLAVDVTYAVCNTLCIPAHGAATLTLTPDGVGRDGAKVAAALAKAPTPVTAGERQALAIRPDPGAGKPSWIVTWAGAGPPIDDMFADAPEGFYFETKTLVPNRFRLTAADVPRQATQARMSLTLTRKGGSLLASESLDVTGANR